MSISTPLKAIFVHVPKAAGSSIVSLDWWDRWESHIPARRYMSRLNWAEWRSFAIIRNPWDRFVSAYEYLRNMTPNHVWYRGNERLAAIAQTSDFESFVERFEELRLFHDNHFRSQLFWISNEQGQVVVNALLRFERLNEGFAELCRWLGVERPSLPHLNRSGCRSKEWRDYYNRSTRSRIAELYADDLQTFKYIWNYPDSTQGAASLEFLAAT